MRSKSYIIRYCQFRRFSRKLRSTKCLVCISAIFFLNLITGFQTYTWLGLSKLFPHRYRLPITHLDTGKLEQNEEYLDAPNNILPNRYLIPNSYLCGRDDRKATRPPHILILVKSAIENEQARQAIRMTWGDKHRSEQYHFKLAFVLGTSKLNMSVARESEVYQDIIQIDKVDSYDQLTYKTIMMLRWVTNHCLLESSKDDFRSYALFIDDDYYLNVDALVEYLKSIDDDDRMTTSERQTFMTGYVHAAALPRRDSSSRWFISMNDYPYEYYPPFLGGGCILMTRYNARLLYIASKYIPILPLEDVYIGLLAYSLSIDPVKNNRRVDPFNSKIKWYEMIFLSLRRFLFGDESRYCITGYRGEQLLTLWNRLYRTNLTSSSMNSIEKYGRRS